MVLFILLGFSFYCIFLSSFHSLVVLLFVEVLVLSCFVILLMSCFSWFVSLMFLLVAVCVGAFGVSLLVANSRSKGLNYFLSF